MPVNTLYPEKHLIYKICEYILEKRRNQTGIGTPIFIKLQEMNGLLEYADCRSDERIETLGQGLQTLHEERFGNSNEIRVINIINSKVLNRFVEAFTNNEVIEIGCTSKNIEDYIKELKARTRAVVQTRRHGGEVGLDPLPSGGVKIVLRDTGMDVGRTKANEFDLRINIVKLMYGKSITLTEGRIISISDYKRSDDISWNNLLVPLRQIEGIDDSHISKINEGSIKDAVRGLNKRSVEIFERVLFEKNDEGLRWVL